MPMVRGPRRNSSYSLIQGPTEKLRVHVPGNDPPARIRKNASPISTTGGAPASSPSHMPSTYWLNRYVPRLQLHWKTTSPLRNGNPSPPGGARFKGPRSGNGELRMLVPLGIDTCAKPGTSPRNRLL